MISIACCPRAIVQARELAKVQEKLDCKRSSLESLSEALRDNSFYDVLEQQDLSQAALDCGVPSDQVIWIGKPTKRTFEMISYYFMGLASEEELLDHIAKLKRHNKAAENDR